MSQKQIALFENLGLPGELSPLIAGLGSRMSMEIERCLSIKLWRRASRRPLWRPVTPPS